ncbi:MAG: ABC transporter substrate-binding protein [Proteobacteria bacterium]|nr:ABC transporter substrate-binding protein [Pseudomonadota bacterium]
MRQRWNWGAIVLIAFVVLPAAGMADGFEYAEDELAFTLNPLHESSMAETRLNELLFESLWGPGYDGSPEPRLADAYELAPDRKSMTVYLRENLLWSDGERITAEDVEFTVKAYQNPRTGSPDRSRLSFIEKASAVAEFTVKFTFHDSESEPLPKLYFKILPEHRFEGTAIERTHPFWFKPTTSGPYELASQDLGTWSLKTNPEAVRPPTVGTVKVREMPDKNQQVSSLGYGYIQAMINVPAQYLPEVERSRAADLIPYQSKSWWYLGMNTKDPELKKVSVRNAVARALDLDQALSLIGEGYRISGPFVPSSKYYNHSDSVQLIDIDDMEASALLEQAGYARGDTGMWARRGEPLSIRVFYRAGMGDQGQTVALNVQSQLRRFGIDATDPVAMDKSVWNEKVFGDRDFDLVLDSWSFDENENIFDLFHSGGTQNFVGYNNKSVDSLLEKALAETDPAAKVAYMQEVHKVLATDQPYVFLWSLRSYTALRREVESVFIQPFYYFSQFPDWRVTSKR